ncbi:MAG TPA: WbqC family protein [Candidatus Omnitrophota bacterium]|nr:WbqC family protein [Candidatus Omnitrophota bacterium]
MKVVISQPRYLPALNYLQRLCFADLFVFLDTVQRQSRGWENRNQILNGDQAKWLTVPIRSSSRELIKHSIIDHPDWIKEHKLSLVKAYEKHPFFEKKSIDAFYKDAEIVFQNSEGRFGAVITHLLKNACALFGFSPKIILASELPHTFDLSHGPAKLADICKEIKATAYISGPNGRAYGVREAFEGSPIKVYFHDFKHPQYRQQGRSGFTPYLAFFDALFNVGFEKTKEWIHDKPVLSET